MDNSADLSENDITEVTMGNLLSSSNENNSETPDTSINDTDSINKVENFEVNNPPNPIQSPTENITETDTSNSKINTLPLKNIEPELVASSSQEKIPSNVDENIDMWLDGKTSELVKEDNEEDFDVIVKSLETAIVETEHYETASIQEPVVSSIEAETEAGENLDGSPMPSLVEMMEDVTQTTKDVVSDVEKCKNETTLEIDPEISESSIVSASTEDNEETILLNSTIESSESDFTLHLEEDQDIENPSISGVHGNIPQVENLANKNEKSNVLNESSDIKIISVTSIVDYDDSSEEEDVSTEVDKPEEKCAENIEVPNNLDDTHESEETSKIVEEIKIVKENTVDAAPVLIENIEKEKITDNITVQESSDKIEMIPEINIKEDDSKITNVSVDQPEIISKIDIVEDKATSKTVIDPIKSTKLEELSEVNEIKPEVKSVETNITELKKDMDNQSIEISNTDATTSDDPSSKLDIEQNLEIKNVAEKIMMSLDDSEEKPRAPPKKIKLIRQKLPTVVKVASIKEKSSAPITLPEKSSPVEMKPFQESVKKTDDASIKSEEEKSDIKLEESFESDEKLFSDIFKIEDEVENKPVKTQKLKLKRNYVTPPVVCKAQVLHSTKIAGVIKEPIKITETYKQPVEVEVNESIKKPVNIAIVEKSIKTIESVGESMKNSESAPEAKKIVADPVEKSEKNVPVESLVKITAPVEEPVKIAASVEEFVKITAPIEEPIKIITNVEESVKIIPPVEESAIIIPPADNPIKVDVSVEKSIKIVNPIEEYIKIDAPVEESIKIDAPVEEPEKITVPVEKSIKTKIPVEESIEIVTPIEKPMKSIVPVEKIIKITCSLEEPENISVPVEEAVKFVAPVEELTKIVDPVEEPVTIVSSVEEAVKNNDPAEEEHIKSASPVEKADSYEESVKIDSPFEELTNIDDPVEEPVKIDSFVGEVENANPVEEFLKISSPVEELMKIADPVEEPVRIDSPIEEPVKIGSLVEELIKIAALAEEPLNNVDSVEETVKIASPIEEPVNIVAPVEESINITQSVEEIVKITESVILEPVKIIEMEEFMKVDETIKESTIVDETVEDGKENNYVEEIFKLSVETTEPISKTINIEVEQSKIEESVGSTSEDAKIIEQPDNLIIEKLLEPAANPELISETKENVTNVEIEEKISETLKPISFKDIIPEMKDIDEVDKISQEYNLNIIESSLSDNLLEKYETVQIENEFEKSEVQNSAENSIIDSMNQHKEVNKKLQEDVKEMHQLTEVSVIQTKTPEPANTIDTETIGKEVIPEYVTLATDAIEKSDLNIETEKIILNLAGTISETENVLVEKTDATIRKIESTSVSANEEMHQKQETVAKAEVRAFETINPMTESRVEKINEKIDNVETMERERERLEPEPKKLEEIQFPLLMSRLQDKLHANMSKSSKHVGRSFASPHVDIQKAAEKAAPTIEADTSNVRIRAMKRKHEAVTKPLTVEIDDLESSDAMMQPSEHENIPKLVIKQMPKQEQRSSPKITIKPIKPPGSPEVSSKRSKMSQDSPNTSRLTIKPLVKPDPLKITITKQKSDDTHSILKIYQPDEDLQDMDETHVPKLTIKSIPKCEEMQHSPKITIKPVKPPGSPKVTVKPIVPPADRDQNLERCHSPKVTVKPVINPEESYPKVTIKPVLKPEETHKVTQISPRQVKLKSMTFDSSSGVTVEPICGTSSSCISSGEHESPMKISVKPFAKLEEGSTAPKLTIKPLTKTCEIVQSEDGTANPLKLTIKPILKPEESYQSPKITIKPIVKPDDHEQHSIIEESSDKPERIILKIQKTNLPSPKERTSSHVRKEPDIKIEAIPSPYNPPENNQKLDKIKLKLTKEGSHAQIIPSITTSHSLIDTHTSFSLKRSLPMTGNTMMQDKRQKSEFSELLHSSDISINLVEPHSRQNVKQISEEVTIMKIDNKSSGNSGGAAESITQMRLKEMLLKISQKPDITCTPHVKQIQQIQQQRDDSSSSDDVRIVEVMEDPLRDPLNEDSSSQDVLIINEVIDTNPFKNVQIINAQTIVEPVQQQFTPKKRGRPRKVPLEVRPEIKGEDCVLSEANNSASESPEGGRPKRTCRAPAGRTPFAVKERKPRGSGRGRGSTRGVRGAKALTPLKLPKEPKSPRGKALKVAKALAKLEAAKLAQEVIIDEITIEDSTNDTPAANTPIPQAESFLKKPDIGVDMQMVDPQPQLQLQAQPLQPKIEMTAANISEIADVKSTTSVSVYEEETRMSASENNSRAQTPARQVFIVPLSAEGPEESQSSVQSSATTESTKNKKGRLEICDPDSAHTTVEQIVEYSWANGGPYMLQEQIAQFLGVKSFKRKYPGLTRRPVDMQERDYIKEKGLVSESMCDMGLTAVPSSEILDIMYTDFQEKYEEYRKCLRDKQSKEISNKQKAISLATSQEKNKIDFKERAIRSSANWNATFNKSRKESRKCCMDLQTFTVNYPTGKNYPRVPHKNPVGSYPIALVPGQFTDYFKAYSPNELNYLPLNTVRYGPILPNQRCLDASDGSSESDSSSGSDSDSSDESMSTDDEITAPSTPVPTTKHLTPLLSTTPKTKVH